MLMGRKTFETVSGFVRAGVAPAWPYLMPVVVLTTTLSEVPSHLGDANVAFASGDLAAVVRDIGAKHGGDPAKPLLYIDGGAVVQACLAAGLVDEMTITTVPRMLFRGVRLFDNADSHTPATTHDGTGQAWALVRAKVDAASGHTCVKYARKAPSAPTA